MEAKFAETLIGTLPVWLILAMALLIFCVYVWGKIRETVADFVPSHRRYIKEKRRLELLKLAYEVEAIKKQHGLTVSDDATLNLTRLEAGDAILTDPPASTEAPLTSLQMALYGYAGGGGISLVVLFARLFSSSNSLDPIAWGFLVGLVVRVIIFGVLGGLSAFIFKSRTKYQAVTIGMLAGFGLDLVITILLQGVPQPRISA
jgi:hypothetical protein